MPDGINVNIEILLAAQRLCWQCKHRLAPECGRVERIMMGEKSAVKGPSEAASTRQRAPPCVMSMNTACTAADSP